MPYHEQLAERVRAVLAADADRVRELKMFGGLCFTLDGNMAVGIHDERLIVRVDPAESDALLAKPHIAPFNLTGRPQDEACACRLGRARSHLRHLAAPDAGSNNEASG